MLRLLRGLAWLVFGLAGSVATLAPHPAS